MRFGLSRNRLWYIRRKLAGYTLLFLSIIFCFRLAGIFLIRIQPSYFARASAFAKNCAAESINRSVNEYFSENSLSTEDFVKTSEDSNGNIKSVESNSIEINRLQASVSSYIFEKLKEESENVVSVPIGSALKNPIFSAMGYRMKIRVSPIGAVKTDIHDEFTEAGINQVKHMLYLDVSVDLAFSNALHNQTENIKTSLLIADTVIVGGVPDYYGASAGIFAAENRQKK